MALSIPTHINLQRFKSQQFLIHILKEYTQIYVKKSTLKFMHNFIQKQQICYCFNNKKTNISTHRENNLISAVKMKEFFINWQPERVFRMVK